MSCINDFKTFRRTFRMTNLGKKTKRLLNFVPVTSCEYRNIIEGAWLNWVQVPRQHGSRDGDDVFCCRVRLEEKSENESWESRNNAEIVKAVRKEPSSDVTVSAPDFGVSLGPTDRSRYGCGFEPRIGHNHENPRVTYCNVQKRNTIMMFPEQTVKTLVETDQWSAWRDSKWNCSWVPQGWSQVKQNKQISKSGKQVKKLEKIQRQMKQNATEHGQNLSTEDRGGTMISDRSFRVCAELFKDRKTNPYWSPIEHTK